MRTTWPAILIGTLNGQDRIVIIDDYRIIGSTKSSCFDSLTFEEVKCHWEDIGQEFTYEEWQAYGNDISENIYERIGR